MSDRRDRPEPLQDSWGLPRHQARVMGTRHMASSANYLASQVALQVLEAGGNAIDAGVAGGIALGVIQCEFVHFAGVAPIMIYAAETREVATISGLGWWPKAASAEYFRKHHGGRIPSGILRQVVPGAPDAWITALERWGSWSFGDCAAQAIRFAEDGYPLSTFAVEIQEESEAACLKMPENARIYMPQGRAGRPGELLIQRDLAATLRYMADEERVAAARGGRAAGLDAARGAFYRGDIARKIAAYHRSAGGWLTEEDLAGFRVGLEPPVRARFGDTDVFTCGPWCQGPVLAQALHTVEALGAVRHGHNTPDYVHALIEALKLAFADRDRFYGDPRFVSVPMDRLVDKAYAHLRAARIDPARAFPDMPPAGTDAELGIAPARPEAPVPAKKWTEPEHDTSYICVVDRHGNCFSATPSDGVLNSPAIPGTGLVPSVRGAQSWTDPAHPACLAPGKRPRLTPSPAIAIRDGRWFMPFGTPGNDVQPQAMLQVFLNIVAFGMPPQAAIEQPRFATFSFPRSSEPHEYYPARMSLERRFDPATVEELRRRGHDATWWIEHDWHAGCVSAIVYDRDRGLLEGGADPRRPGAVATL